MSRSEVSPSALAKPWTDGRPIYHRLPYKGYRDNPVADFVTEPMDYNIIAIKNLLQQFYSRINPATCSEADMDYVGFLYGFSGGFWDTNWSETVKRSFITNAVLLWRSRGSIASIGSVLAIHNIQHDIFTDGLLLVPFTIPSTLGTPKARVFIRLPLLYLRNSAQWLEAERSRNNWLSATILSKVCYNKFYVGFSVVGEPIFS